MLLELRNVSVGYDVSHVILKGINLSVETGEICCLLGPNGVGKTTLFRSILQFLPIWGGQIRIDGHDIRTWHPSQLAKHMAYVAQYHNPPFPYEVKDVVLLGRVNSTRYFGQPNRQDYEIVENAMEEMGIHHLRNRIYTDISGGERQLVMIARALAQQPKYLIMDEPTASLDYGNTVTVLRQIKRLKDLGYGVVMTTHNPDHAFLCQSKVALLQRNEPLLYGSAVDVVTEKNLRSAYGVDVGILEYINRQGELMRVCTPEV
jgi:iron complex transport system ATP-binding protein